MLLVKSREGLALSEALGSDGAGSMARAYNDSDPCVGHAEGTVVEADVGHFTLLINFCYENQLSVWNSLINKCSKIRRKQITNEPGPSGGHLSHRERLAEV